MTTKTSRVWAIGALVTLVTGLTACLKSSDVTPQEASSYFYVANASTAFTAFDFFDNDVKQTSSNGFSFLANTIYQTSTGVHTFKVKKLGGDSTMATATNVYDSSELTSLFIYDLPTYATGIREISENFTNLSSTKINVRFFNLSVDAPAVDVYLDNIKIDSTHSYEGNGNNFYPPFDQITASNTSTIKLTKAGSDSTIAQINATLAAGRTYTIYLGGRAAFTDSRKLSVGYITH